MLVLVFHTNFGSNFVPVPPKCGLANMQKCNSGNLVRKNENLHYASLCDTCNLGNNDENYCKNVTTVAKKNGDIITIMRHYEYINMKILKTCKVCGKPFVGSKMTYKYCSPECKNVAKCEANMRYKRKVRKKEISDEENSCQKDLYIKPFLTPLEVSDILGVSISTVYRYFYTGTIKAVHLRKKTFVRREDIDEYFKTAPSYKKRSYKKVEDKEYYTLREIMEKYHVGRKAIWGRCDKMGIPKIYQGRNTFFNKKAIDALFSDMVDDVNLDNYYETSEVMSKYNISHTAVLSLVSRHNVPRVKRNNKVYYSKIHIDSIKRKEDGPDPNWYTYPEISERYGFTKDQISYTLKSYDIRTEKRGKFTMIYRTDFDKVAAKRLEGAERIKHVDGTSSIVMQSMPKERTCPPTPEGYYSTEEVADMFKSSHRYVGVITRQHEIPKIALKGFNFYEKAAIDMLYNQKNKFADITDWITPEEMRSTFKMSECACRSFIKRHKIPAKVEYGKTYYSKQHIIDVKESNFEGRDRYYDIDEASQKYKISKDVVRYYAKHYHITNVRHGKFVYFKKDELDRVVKERQKIRLDKNNIENIEK